MSAPQYIDAATIAAALPPAAAVEAITATLRSGFDPAADIPRTSAQLGSGHLLLMPAEAGPVAGIKLAAVAPGNPEIGLPRIQASYLLYDARTLALLAMLDGTALTSLRTPAVSVAAVLPILRRFAEPPDLVVFGAGPQAVGHVDALAEASPVGIGSTTFVLRRPGRAGQAVLARGDIVPAGTAEAAAAMAGAGVIVCATSARTPLFPGTAVAPGAVVIAVGSHEPDARELDTALMAPSSVIVEDRATALREAGDVILAQHDGALSADDLIPMKEVVNGVVDPPRDRPVVFKSVGMSWQDLSIAHAVFTRST